MINFFFDYQNDIDSSCEQKLKVQVDLLPGNDFQDNN